MKIKEISRFIVVGCGAVLTDFIIYNLCLTFLPMIHSKIISFLFGSFVAFIANKLWTFERKNNEPNEILKFGLLYLTSLILNTSTNKIIFDSTDNKTISFVFSTGFSTFLNFAGQKYWVFK